MDNALTTFTQLTKELLQDEKTKPVADYIATSDLLSTLDLELSDDPLDEQSFYESLKEVVLATPRTATKAFFNQLFGGRNEKAVLGDLLAVILNNSMYTYKAAGPQTGIEKVVVSKICDLIGWGTDAGGTLGPGGSMTNFMSMLMARDRHNHQVRHAGMTPNATVYTSRESHYSIPKNAAFAGVGRDQVRYIDTDQFGAMDPGQLISTIEADVAAGLSPMLINATAGTTVLGAFDKLERLSKISKQFGAWLHVDGAYCGAVLFSDKYRHLIAGVEEADSFSVNAHKMLSTPLSCSIIVVKDKKHLYESFANNADYLYQTDHDEFNLGKMSLQCGRRNDALKLWALWKSVGTTGLKAIVDHQFDLADVARQYIRNHPDYTLYSFDESVSVCFNYKDLPAVDICTQLYEQQQLLVGYGEFAGKQFIRLVTINAQNSKAEILEFFSTLERFAEQTFSPATV